MEFDVAGAFEIPRYGYKRIISKKSLDDLKPVVEEWEEGLSEACGCYVFALQTGRGTEPYYVGQACRRPLLKEALNASNRGKYNDVMADKIRGRPVLYLLPMRTPGGKFRRRKSGNGRLAALDFLERWLIATALERNPGLINNKETRFLRKIHVRGIFNARRGEATEDAQKLNSVLWRS